MVFMIIISQRRKTGRFKLRIQAKTATERSFGFQPSEMAKTSDIPPGFLDEAKLNLTSDLSPSDSSAPRKMRETVNIGVCKVPLFWANVFFAAAVLITLVAEKVSLPLWIDSIDGLNTTLGPTVDSYFVLSFSSLSFFMILGLGMLYIRIFSPKAIGEAERTFPHLLIFLIGFCDSVNGVLVVYASKGSRTPPYLQAILGNFLIPLTILFRLLILRKKPTTLKLLCGVAVLSGLFICLVPTIFPKVIRKDSEEAIFTGDSFSRVMWPIIFMLASLPEALMRVLEERGVKMENNTSTSAEQINLVYFLFWTNTYELCCVALFFWTDVLPWYGDLDDIRNFGTTWWSSLQCFFGGAGCGAVTRVRGTVHILAHVAAHLASANLLRYSEGATWLAIVTSLVTPLGFLFWTFFDESPLKWHPQDNVSTWFSIGALSLMVPAIFVYNMGAPEISVSPDETKCQEIHCSANSLVMDLEQPAANPEEILLSTSTRITNYSTFADS